MLDREGIMRGTWKVAGAGPDVRGIDQEREMVSNTRRPFFSSPPNT